MREAAPALSFLKTVSGNRQPTAMYLFLFLLFRVVVKRRVGAIGMADILILVIVAD